jgi:hypothetical protein
LLSKSFAALKLTQSNRYASTVDDEGMTDEQGSVEPVWVNEVPRYYTNLVNVSLGSYDVVLTFLESDSTLLPATPPTNDSWRTSGLAPKCQVVMSLGHAKALIPLLVKGIADFETRFGVIPAPGFDESSKG